MIRITNIGICTISLFAFCFRLPAQTADELNHLKRKNILNEKSVYIREAKQYNSEYDWFFGNLFVFYKTCISSQDASSCSFTPSCSEYALIAIKKEGLVEGLVNFWDRFSRCNGMSPENYPVDYVHKVLIDPVRDWHYNEK